jgi:hypothetical protein
MVEHKHLMIAISVTFDFKWLQSNATVLNLIMAKMFRGLVRFYSQT